MNLFEENLTANTAPLAERMRPQNLNDFSGQEHLIGPGKPVRIMIENNEPASMILWGPPGVGKTTLALLISKLVQSDFIQLSAISSAKEKWHCFFSIEKEEKLFYLLMRYTDSIKLSRIRCFRVLSAEQLFSLEQQRKTLLLKLSHLCFQEAESLFLKN